MDLQEKEELKPEFVTNNFWKNPGSEKAAEECDVDSLLAELED